MHSFYIEATGQIGESCRLPKDEAKHAARVLRLRAGDIICAMDGHGARFEAEIESVDVDEVSVRLLAEMDSHEAPVRVTLYQGVPKADKLELITQKITELGAFALVPVKMERCVVKLDEKDGIKRCERLSKIAYEATKQCRRATMLSIVPPQTWKQSLALMQRHDLVIVPWEEVQGCRMKDMLSAHPEAVDIGIVIGPEGGMSAKEIEAMRAISAQPITLGPRILRAETAAVVSVAMTMTLWGDL